MSDFFSGLGDFFSGIFGGGGMSPSAAPDNSVNLQAADFILSDWSQTPQDVVRRGWENNSLDESFWGALKAINSGKGNAPLSDLIRPGTATNAVFRTQAPRVVTRSVVEQPQAQPDPLSAVPPDLRSPQLSSLDAPDTATPADPGKSLYNPSVPPDLRALSPDKDYSKASGKEISQGIYDAFRKLGYTDFGAKTMLAEIHREHGAEFSNDGPSAGRRPFGFEQEPARRDQVNFGFINSTGKRTAELLQFLGKEGLVSYDAPKSRLNPQGIRVENSQKALDVMAAWYDNDLKVNGARDRHAIIRGADPKQLPTLLRDPNYKDVHDAHRRTAAWIQWQHPEIYGGRYYYGIAGIRHYNNMLMNRASFDRWLINRSP